jgi:hypothetical protein
VPLDKSKTRRNLKKKGFIEDPGKHHIYYRYVTISGKESSINTKISHSVKDKDISDDLTSCMARECRLSIKQFKDLANCPLTRADFEKIVFDT